MLLLNMFLLPFLKLLLPLLLCTVAAASSAVDAGFQI
jgi:hypothetical protein